MSGGGSAHEGRKAGSLSPNLRKAHQWFLDHGGDGAVARGSAGGRLYLFQGESAPFMPVTVNKLIEAGLAEFYGEKPNLRLRVFAPSREPQDSAARRARPVVAPAPPKAVPAPKRPLIDLADVPSSMELMAAKWKRT